MATESKTQGDIIVEGFKEDCCTLLKRFENRQSFRFECFAKEWTAMKFSHVFYCKSHFLLMLEFTEEIFLLAKDFIGPNYNMITRVGGLYLLYSLYHKQIIKNYIKIRVTMEDWKFLLEILKFCKDGQHHDAAWIFAKMFSESVFDHVAVSRELGIDRGFSKYFKEVTENVKIKSETNIVDTLSVTGLEEIEKCYVNTKSKVFGDDGLNLIINEFSENLKIKLDKLKEVREDETDDLNLGNKRRKLKNKAAFGQEAKDSVLNELYFTSNEEPSINERKKTGKRKREEEVEMSEEEENPSPGQTVNEDLPLLV